MSAISLLADAQRVIAALPGIPEGLEGLPWEIAGNKGRASIAALGGHRLAPDPDHPGQQILVCWLPPPSLPIINALHAAGWRRGGRYATCGPHWIIYAYLRRGDDEIRIEGSTGEREDGVDNSAIPFFAPEPPALSRRKGFLAEYREWERKCFQDEW